MNKRTYELYHVNAKRVDAVKQLTDEEARVRNEVLRKKGESYRWIPRRKTTPDAVLDDIDEVARSLGFEPLGEWEVSQGEQRAPPGYRKEKN